MFGRKPAPTRNPILYFKKTEGGQPHHTVLSDINELTCFVALCNPDAVAKGPIRRLGDAKPPYTLVRAVEDEFRTIQSKMSRAELLDRADKEAFDQLQRRFNVVFSSGKPRSPKWYQAAGIKMVQGYNEAIYLLAWSKQTKQNITEAYFTNDPAKFNAALKATDMDVYNAYLRLNPHRANPADVVIVAGGKVRGVSLKASFGNCPPVIANMGKGGPSDLWDIRDRQAAVTAAYDAKNMARKEVLLREATLAVVKDVTDVHTGFGRPGGGTRLLQELLHCQDGNVPYFLVAAQTGDCYGIDFASFGRWLQRQTYTVTHTPTRSIGQPLLFKSSTGGPNILLGFRVKRSGKSSPSLKVNVTMTPQFKKLLKDEYGMPIGSWLSSWWRGGSRRGLSKRSGSKSKRGGMKLRSGKEYTAIAVPAAPIRAAIGRVVDGPRAACEVDEEIDEGEETPALRLPPGWGDSGSGGGGGGGLLDVIDAMGKAVDAGRAQFSEDGSDRAAAVERLRLTMPPAGRRGSFGVFRDEPSLLEELGLSGLMEAGNSDTKGYDDSAGGLPASAADHGAKDCPRGCNCAAAKAHCAKRCAGMRASDGKRCNRGACKKEFCRDHKVKYGGRRRKTRKRRKTRLRRRRRGTRKRRRKTRRRKHRRRRRRKTRRKKKY